MKYNELVSTFAVEADLTRVKAKQMIGKLANIVAEATKKDGEVRFKGLGIFKSQLQKGKSGKVPGTDKVYTTQDKMVPKFSASKSFKDIVAGN